MIKHILKFKFVIVLTGLLVTVTTTNAQVKVGDAPTTINANSVLEVESTNKGLLLPRIALTATNAAAPLTAHIAGMAVYNTATAGTAPNNVSPGYYFNDGVKWLKISATDDIKEPWYNMATATGATTNTQNIYQMANVGIGIDTLNKYARLHVAGTNQGILLPNVNLTTQNLDLNADGDNNVANQPAGLLIFNSGSVFEKGFYYWNGIEWRAVDNTVAANPSVANIDCNSAILSPAVYYAGTPYTGILKISYTGGNGGKYLSGNTVTANGLSFKLQEGRLEYGTGELIFVVSGNPSASSPTVTAVPINSTSVPFYTGSCTANVGDQELADVKVAATVGPLTITADPSAGYHKILTSPDGKFSVRVVIKSGQSIDLSDLQIRSNSGTPTILWNAGTYYVNGTIHDGNNGMTFPAQGVWYGNGGGSGTTMGTAIDNAWSDADVYYGSPELRRYTWTNTDPADKTVYTLNFMLGAPTATQVANTTNCPSGVCTSTKAFLKIEQVKGL